MKLDNIDVIILDAGRGRRLRPITNIYPKCLLTIQGISILERQIKQMSSFGLNKFIFCVGYKKNRIKHELIKHRNKYKLQVYYKVNPQFSSTGTLYSLYLSLSKINGAAVLINGDVVIDIEPIQRLIEHINIDKTSSMLVVKSGKADIEAVRVLLDKKNGVIKRISKKIDLSVSEGEFTGIAYLSKYYIKQLKVLIPQLIRGNKNEFYEFAFEKSVINYGSELKTLAFKRSRFVEIDTYEDYLRAKQLFNNHL